MAQYNVTNGVTSTGKILNNDNMFVSNGGTADNTTVNADGYLYVLSGGKADHTTVNADAYSLYGRLYVSSGGTADHVTTIIFSLFFPDKEPKQPFKVAK